MRDLEPMRDKEPWRDLEPLMQLVTAHVRATLTPRQHGRAALEEVHATLLREQYAGSSN